MADKKTSASTAPVCAALLCAVIAAAAAFLLYANLRALIENSRRAPIGTIAEKTGALEVARESGFGLTAQSRLSENSPVFSGDTIKTGGFSEAALLCADGGEIRLSERSALKLGVDTKSRVRVELLAGTVAITAKSAGLVAAGGGESAALYPESAAQAGMDAGRFFLRVVSGKASIQDSSGAIQLITEGGAIGGGSLVMLSPPPYAESSLPTFFSWTSANPDESIRLDIAHDPRFSRIVETVLSDPGSSGTVLRLPPGAYWWRAYPSTSPPPSTPTIPSGKFF
jgi:hypothetical protein